MGSNIAERQEESVIRKIFFLINLTGLLRGKV